jgi:hypothetical protein
LELGTEQLEIHGFGNAGITTGLEKAQLFRHHGVGGHCNDRNMTQFRLLPHPRGQGKAIFIAKLYIEQHCVRLLIREHETRSAQILCA